MTVAIVGYGFVGKAMHKLFPEATIHDPKLDKPTATQNDVNKCDVVFICVPTPVIDEGKLDTSIVEEVISWCESKYIIIRSTVNPHDCEKWVFKYREKVIVYQPEFIGESPAHPLLDEKARAFLILGGLPDARRKVIELYQTVYNANITIRQLTWLEAEVAKLSENRAIAFKVAQCQELFDVCEKEGIDYYQIRETVYGDDPRFNLWWTFVFVNKRGLQSKCLPKDCYAWCAWAESLGYKPEITRALLERNKKWISQ